MTEEEGRVIAIRILELNREQDGGDPVKLTARIAAKLMDVVEQERRDCADYVRYVHEQPHVADELEHREERIDELLDLRCASVSLAALI